jgi:hypothetical protein
MTILYNDWLHQNDAEDTPENRSAWVRETGVPYSSGYRGEDAAASYFGWLSQNPQLWGAGTATIGMWRDGEQKEAPPIPVPKEGQFPHPGIEWEKDGDDYFYFIALDETRIEPNPLGDGYIFTNYDLENSDWDNVTGDVTPETIDEIIAKLQHFKRVVFGEGE